MPWIKKKVGAETLSTVAEWAKKAVLYAEQVMTASTGEEKKQAVDEMIHLVGLDEYRKYYPNEISSSMLQRVVIARAFATRPELLLMDEPYGQLDIELRFKLEDELIKLWKRTEMNITVRRSRQSGVA